MRSLPTGAPPNPETAALLAELEETRSRLREMEYLLEAIQSGQADALVINGPAGEQVFTLKSLDVLVDSIVENSLGATLLVNGEGTILRASPAAVDLGLGDPRGLPFDEAFPISLAGGVPSGSGDAGAGRFSVQEILGGRSVSGLEAVLERKDGAVLHLLLAAKPLTPFGGLFKGAVVNLLDITARKRAEVQLTVRNKQLRYQSELTKTITDNAAEALFLADLEGRIVFMNPAAEEMLGWRLGDVLGRLFHELVHPHAHPGAEGPCPLEKLLGPGFGVGINEDRFTRADGTVLAVRYSKAPVVSEGKVTGTVIGVGDVTQRNETEAALRLSEEKLRQSQKMEAIGRLAGGIAHDFNNLLTAINGYSALAMEALDPADRLHGYMVEIHKSGERAAALTSHLLAYSRKQILAFKVVDLNALAAESMAVFARTLGENIVYDLDLHPAPCRVKADPFRIQQVLVNLAINARDAMPQGGRLRVETRIVTVTDPDRSGLLGEMARDMEEALGPGDYVRISMTDTGHGMDDNVKAHLFEPFFTTKGVGAGPGGRSGTGLGLSMAYGIVKQSHGHIQVFSEAGRGTTVHILLPLVPEEARAETPACPGARAGGRETVLIVEDEPSVLTLLRHVLEHAGYRVLEARGGEEALAVADSHPGRIDLLITDMVMGGMGGRELSQHLRGRRPETRRIFISGYTGDIALGEGAGDGEDIFLQKPFSPETLSCAVRRSLDRPWDVPAPG